MHYAIKSRLCSNAVSHIGAAPNQQVFNAGGVRGVLGQLIHTQHILKIDNVDRKTSRCIFMQ